MNARTKHTRINQATKKIVWNRDGGCCIVCGKPVDVSLSNAHIVPRSKGGSGEEQNIVTLCPVCHFMLDQTTHRKKMMDMVIEYIRNIYPDWDEQEQKFKKGI